MKILKFDLLGPSANRAYPLHALSPPDQIRSEKSVFRSCGGGNRSGNDCQGPGAPLGSCRNRWGQSGDVLDRLRLKNHENLEIYPSLGLLKEAGADLEI